MKAKKPLAVAVVAAASLVLAACSPGSTQGSTGPTAATGPITGKVSIQTWSLTPKFTDYLNETIDGFEKANPGTEVELLDQPGDGYADKVLSQAGSNTLPDVINLPPEFAYPLAKRGMLLDVAASEPTLDADYVKGGLDGYRYAGVQGTFAFPWYLNTDINYWNTDLLQKAGLDPNALPTDLDGLLAAAKQYSAQEKDTFLLSAKPSFSDFVAAGIPILNAEGTQFSFNTPEAVALVQKYVDAYKEGLLPSNVLNDDFQGNAKLFTQKRVAWTTGGAPAASAFVVDNPSLKGQFKPSKAIGTAPLYIQGLSVSAKSQNAPTAVALAKWFTNPENQKKFAELTNTFPSTTATAQDPSFSQSDGSVEQDAKVLAFEALKDARMLTPNIANDTMKDFFDQQVGAAMKGDISAQEALDKSVEFYNQQLAEAAAQ